MGRLGSRPLRKGLFFSITMVNRKSLIATADTARRVPTTKNKRFLYIRRGRVPTRPETLPIYQFKIRAAILSKQTDFSTRFARRGTRLNYSLIYLRNGKSYSLY